MTKLLLALLGAAVLSSPAAFAQSPMPSPSDNFVLNLFAVEKDGESISMIVTGSQSFNVSRTGLTFNGTLNKTDTGGYRLDYLLETSASRSGTIHTGSSVVLRPGEPVQLVKNGEQFYNLRLDHYPPTQMDKTEPPPPVATH